MVSLKQCKGCRKATDTSVLGQNNGLCEKCWGAVSAEQELELWQLYALRQAQWCHARNPHSGRPCWLQTKAKDAYCHKADCVKNKKAD